MGEPNRRKLNRAIVEARRRRVATLKLRGLSAREIQTALGNPPKPMLNPFTGKSYSLGTIGTDLVVLKKRWMEESARDIREHQARELAELQEHRRAAWSAKEYGEVRLGIALEMRLLGAGAPQRHEHKLEFAGLTDAELDKQIAEAIASVVEETPSGEKESQPGAQAGDDGR